MKLIVGLGNPGSSYERTRHNAGFMALDRVAARHARGGGGGGGAGGVLPRQRFSGEVMETPINGERTVLLKPLRFMNCSGSSVAEAVNFYKLNPAADLLVLVDDYALPLGALRVRAEGSPGGHNGLSDIQRALGTSAYPRLRIGVDPPPPEFNDPADWVLGRFSDREAQALAPALERAVDAVEMFIAHGLERAMNTFNARPKPAGPPSPSPAASPSLPGTAPVIPKPTS